MTLLDLVLDRCACVVNTLDSATPRDTISDMLSDAILEIHGMQDRKVTMFLAPNYVHIILELEVSFIGVVERNEFGLSWGRN